MSDSPSFKSRRSGSTPEKGSGIRAVLLGLAVDIGGSTLAGFVLSVAYAISVAPDGASPEQIAESLQNIPQDSWLAIAAMIVGGGFSLLGGYVCARVAKHSEFALGAVLALLSITFGFWASPEEDSWLLDFALAAATFLAVMFGVRFGAARNERS